MNKKFEKWWMRVKLPEWWKDMDMSRGRELAKKAYRLGREHQKAIDNGDKSYDQYRNW